MTYTWQFIYWLLYFGLAGGGFLFLQETLQEFLNEKTDFHTDTAALMTARDIPTLSICFDDVPQKMENKIEICIGMYTVKNSTIHEKNCMVEGENNITDVSGMTHYLKLESLKVLQHKQLFKRKCVKVSPLEKELESELISKNRYRFGVFINKPIVSHARLYVTSEENAYGVTLEKWFDGKVEPYILKNQTYHRLAIELNEIHRLSPHCEKQSYYECVAKKMDEDSTCPSLFCLPFTLPLITRNQDYQHCNSTDSEICMKIFKSLYEDEGICKGQAKCIVSEYIASDSIPPDTYVGPNGFLFQIHRIGHPISSGGKRIGKPIKTVNTEYYILDACV